MTARTLPPEVTAECALRLQQIAGELARDAATLNRATAMLYSRKDGPGRVSVVLKRYATHFGQYRGDEVLEIAEIIMSARPKPKRRSRKRQIAAEEGNVVFLRRNGHEAARGDQDGAPAA